MNILLVFLGGGAGSIVRYLIGLWIQPLAVKFPIATLVSNVLACLIIGMVTGLSLKGGIDDQYKLLLATGFCGGFSTFSTFSNETIQLFQSGQMVYAFLNILIGVVVCLAAVVIGMKLVG
jgi:fluoride exporter